MTNATTDYTKRATVTRGVTTTGVGGITTIVSVWLTNRYELDADMAVLLSGAGATIATAMWRMLCHWYACSNGSLAVRLRALLGNPTP